MKVLAYSRSLRTAPENEFYKTASLDEIYALSDVISLHCPLNDDSRGMINEKTISQMKDGVIIINTARGALINEKALAAALSSGKVSAAGLDVTCEEPLPDSSPLLRAKNCFITPHIAWAPKETLERCMNIAAESLKSFLAGKPVNVVNP
jgi:glycerate dehydrogenase